MSLKFGIKIMPRSVILDSQGRAVEYTLKMQDMAVETCRVGKYVELVFDEPEATAKVKAEKIAKEVLHNPLIETYEITLVK